GGTLIAPAKYYPAPTVPERCRSSTRGTRRKSDDLVSSHPSPSCSRVAHEFGTRTLRIPDGSDVRSDHLASPNYCQPAGRHSLLGEREVRRMKLARAGTRLRSTEPAPCSN